MNGLHSKNDKNDNQSKNNLKFYSTEIRLDIRQPGIQIEVIVIDFINSEAYLGL